MVLPNGEHVYYWETSSNVSPQPNDPTCLTYSYISHEHFVEDFNLGLVGALLICKPGKKQNISVLSICLSLHFCFCFSETCHVLLSQKAVWMSRGSKLAFTMSTSSSLGFLMRTRASTNKAALPQTLTSNTQSMGMHRDHCQVSTFHQHLIITLMPCVVVP